MYFSRDKRDVSIKRDLFPPPPLKYIFYIYICTHERIYYTRNENSRKNFNKISSNENEIWSRTTKLCCAMTKFFSLANETKFFPPPPAISRGNLFNRNFRFLRSSFLHERRRIRKRKIDFRDRCPDYCKNIFRRLFLPDPIWWKDLR